MTAVLLALVLALSLLSATALAAEGGYRDTDGHWAEEAIDRWSDYGIIQGSDGLFNPDGALTRAHMAAILTRLLGLPAAKSAGFADVQEGDWFADPINRCAAAGIMLGADGRANPNARITRQQAMVMLARALGIQPVEKADLSAYKDGGAVSAYARGYVAAMLQAGIVNGVSEDTLGVGGQITRAATVTMLDRAIVTYVHEPNTRVEAVSGGIVLVAADGVELTGRADTVLVAQGAGGGTVRLKGVTAEDLVVTAAHTTVVVDSRSAVRSILLTEQAVGSRVVVEKGGKVESVTTSGDNTTVTTKGTEVEVEKGTTGTTAGGKDVAGGTTVTTPGGSTSGGSSSGGSSSGGSVHSHSYTYRDNGNGTHTGTCSCGATVGPEAHKVGDAGTCTVCGAGGFVARIGTTGYKNLQDALNVGGDVVLVKDVIATETTFQVKDGKNVVLNLNGKTLSGGGYDATLRVSGGAKLTINGDGNVIGNDQKRYGMAVWAVDEGSLVVINGGNYSNVMNHEGDKQLDMIYVSDGGDAEINGGTFKCATPMWTLNIKDGNYSDKSSTIVVKGGTFYQYDPSHAANENPVANFVAPGYSSVKDGENYKVLEGTYVSTEEQLNAALSNPDVDTVYLADDITLSAYLEIKRSVTMIGADGVKKLSIVNDGDKKDRVINITGNTEAVTLTLKDLDIVGPTTGDSPRGISAYANSGALKIVLDNCSVSAGHYPINIASDCPDVEVTVKGGTYKGYCAMQTHSPNTKVTFEGCTLIGDNVFELNEWNRFATLVINATAPGADLSFKNCRIEANNPTGNTQFLLSVRTSGAKVTLDDCTYFQNGSEIEEEKLGSFLQVYPEAADLQLTIDGTQIPIQ